MDSMGSLVVSLRAEISEFIDPLTKAQYVSHQAVTSIASGLNSLTSSFASVAAAAGGVVAGAGFTALVTSVVEAQNHMSSMAQQIGATVEQFSSLQRAALVSNTAMESIAGASDKLSKGIATAGEAGNKTTKALELLGFSGDQLKTMLENPAEAMRMIAQRLNEFPDSGAKAAYAMLLFGKSGAEAIPFLRALGEQTTLTGTISTASAKEAEAFHKQIVDLQLSSQAFARSLVSNMIPTMSVLLDQFVKGKVVIGEFASGFTGVQTGAQIFASMAGIVVDSFRLIGTALYSTVGAFFGGFAAIISNAVELLNNFLAKLHLKSDTNSNVQQFLTDLTKGLREAGSALDKFDANKFERMFAQAAQVQQLVNAANSGAYGEGKDRLLNTKLPDPGKETSSKDNPELDRLRGLIASLDAETRKYNDALNGLAATDTSLNKILDDYNIRLLKLLETHKSMTPAEAALWEATAKSAMATDTARVADQARTAGLADLAKFIAALAQVTREQTNAVATYNDRITDEVSRYRDEVTAIGLSSSAIKIFAENRKIDIELRTLQEHLMKDMAALDALEAAAILDQTGLLRMLLDAKHAQIIADGAMAAAAADGAKTRIAADIAAQESFSAGWAKTLAAYKNGLSDASIAQHAFNTLTQSMETLFVNMANNATNAFKTFRDSVLQMIEQMAAKMAISGIMSLISGGASASGGGASGSTGGFGLGQLASTGSSLYGLAAGTGAFGVAAGAGFSAGIETLGIAFSAGAEAIGGASAVLGATAAVALPVIGIALAAYAAYEMLAPKRGGPKSGGYASIGDIGQLPSGAGPGGRYYTPTNADPALRGLVGTIGTDFKTALTALGGTGSAGFALGYDTDPKGTAGGRVSAGVQIDGKTIFNQLVGGLGNDSGAITAALTTASNRALLAALQASNLPQDIALLLNSVIATTGTDKAIGNIIAQAEALKSVGDLLARNALADAMTAIKTQSSSASEALKTMGTQLTTLGAAYDYTAAASTRLVTATQAYYTAAVLMIAQIETIKAAIGSMFGDTIRALTLSTLDNVGKYAFYQKDASSLYKQLQGTADPTQIQDIAKKINADINAAFGLLTPEQQKSQLGTFTDNLGKLNADIQEKLGKVQSDTKDAATAILQTIQTTLAQAGADQLAAAGTQLVAANTPLRVNVGVDVTNNTVTAQTNFG